VGGAGDCAETLRAPRVPASGNLLRSSTVFSPFNILDACLGWMLTRTSRVNSGMASIAYPSAESTPLNHANLDRSKPVVSAAKGSPIASRLLGASRPQQGQVPGLRSAPGSLPPVRRRRTGLERLRTESLASPDGYWKLASRDWAAESNSRGYGANFCTRDTAQRDRTGWLGM
jgi:hypothetical protein